MDGIVSYDNRWNIRYIWGYSLGVPITEETLLSKTFFSQTPYVGKVRKVRFTVDLVEEIVAKGGSVRFGQARLGQVRLGKGGDNAQTFLSQTFLSQTLSLGKVRKVRFTVDLVGERVAKVGSVRLGQVRFGQVRLGKGGDKHPDLPQQDFPQPDPFP